jgi:hypothetical protein
VTRGKYYIDKIYTNMGGSKNAKKPNKKGVLYNISKDQNSKIG